jgi:hypothetical protein
MRRDWLDKGRDWVMLRRKGLMLPRTDVKYRGLNRSSDELSEGGESKQIF